MKFSYIEQLTKDGHYQVHQSWRYLKDCLAHYNDIGLNLDPDFQRGHVWTETQQQKYVEFMLRGGRGANVIRFNCVGWMKNFKGPFEIVDGKQRLTAALKFLNNELEVFGCFLSDFEEKIPIEVDFVFQINDLKTRKQVLQWYIDLNSAGTPHSNEEIERVKNLLAQEQFVP
jgi:uncharacterized protein with ParB-like and HNH nuclease domain